LNHATFLIRTAGLADLEAIVGFNERLALETEHRISDRALLDRGVHAALTDPDRLRYWVAVDPVTGEVVGQAAVTHEWSDWRNGWLWWLQSVYVRPDARVQGVFRSLYAHIRSAARESADVVGIRLYVEQDNDRAQHTYLVLGMTAAGYQVFEEIWWDRSGGT
jgi:GNAT superfamily N-acetyltransferase